MQTEPFSNPTGSLDLVRLLHALDALEKGDFSVRLPLEWIGVAGKVADTFNRVVSLNQRMVHELEQVSRVVGKEGRLSQRATMGDVSGDWQDAIQSVNTLVDDLVRPTSETARVIGAVAQGDLSQTMALEVDDKPLQGEFLRTARLVNKMVDQLSTFASEVTRVAREVGTEGKLGGQADVRGVAGTWKDLTDSVNSMAGNLTSQVRNIAQVTKAVAMGDLSRKITVDVKGEILDLKDTINTMVDQLNSFASEVTRVAREVGTEGKLGGQADVRGVAGTWKDLTDSVNSMAGNLTSQVRNIAQVTKAVATGDLSKKITVDVKGEILDLKDTINTMVDQLRSFASEVTRVAREVGTDGKLGGQADVRGVAGTWKDLTDSVNFMAGNLTSQVRNIAQVTKAVATGDLSKKITVDVKGEILDLKDTINTMVDQLNSFASEVTRVAREVGTEGKLGGQADVRGVAGTWKDLTDSVNSMAGNLTSQVRNIAQVTKAVATGDLSKKITVDVKGEILDLKDTINTMVDQLSTFASEVTRVAREVGTDGKLGGQADVRGVAGTWKDLTDSVNFMAGNLTSQVRNIAQVTKAVAMGDLSRKITVDVKGEILELKTTINTMVDQLNSFASEVTRVAREVGTEGKLGGQAQVRGVAGTWKDLTDSVNFMAGNLTSQVRNIADVSKAIAAGDLSRKITVDVKGEILELKNTINTMVDQLNSFASEVTRVAREVGTEGKLGGQSNVEGVAGTWKDLTDSVNFMAGNLTSQVRNIADVSKAIAAGDLSRKITVDVKGEILELKDTINTMVDQLRSFASEVTRVAREVGTEGKLGGQANVEGVAGTWKDLTDSVNFMAGNLTSQVRNIAQVTKAVAMGDLSRKITVDVKGEILELKNTINTMVDQLNSFASEVTRVAREVGTDGKLGGQAQVQGVSGTWKDLTDSVNFMAGNLTSQVRGIAKVVTFVANGDLKRKLVLEAKGEIAELAETINEMIDTLATFAEQVTTMAREVGVEGKLGGQAKVPGASGTWKDLTDNVNQLAANLTTQVRAIAEVATAVTKGDLTRSITVEAQGEVAALKDNINEMIRNLRETTQKNTEQDWLKTNLAKFSRMLQGQRDLTTVGRMILSELAPVVAAQQAVFYILDSHRDTSVLSLLASYAGRKLASPLQTTLELGEGLVGQCALDKQKIAITSAPPEYIRVSSALGDSAPQSIIILPVIFEGQVKGVLEMASLDRFNSTHLAFLEQLCESIGIVINTIEANMRTEDLLKQSQSLAHELQARGEELEKTNEELQEKARLLAHQNQEVERKNQEVEQARQALEEKAKQLSLTSKYKSEFLANMSHELRTPLNSLLILSDQLSKNPEGNLSPKQKEFAKTIHSSGNDLLMLINDILDLSKIESGTVVVDASEVRLDELRGYVERTFRHVAESKSVDFHIRLDPRLPRSLVTDAKRLQQVLKNLLSNAFKFTHHGYVELRVELVKEGWSSDLEDLNRSPQVLAFGVSDTGIGISADKQLIIFEAFQQADGSTSRKYGGTGLGLAISRELSRLLGGEIRLVSSPGKGSTFTLYLPQLYMPTRVRTTQSRSLGQASGEHPALPSPLPLLSLPGVSPAAATGPSPVASPVVVDSPSSPSRISAPSDTSSVLAEDQAAYEAELANPFGDDRGMIQPGDQVLLIVENDLAFARFLLDTAREKGFKGLVTPLGATALTLTREYKPHAITLDIFLPDIEGWRVLDRLKNDLETRHIPVAVISTDESRQRALEAGALAFIAKPLQSKDGLEVLLDQLKEFIGRPQRRVVVLEADEKLRGLLVQTLAAEDVEIIPAANIGEVLPRLGTRQLDCLVTGPAPLDLDPDLLENPTPPVVRGLPLLVYDPDGTDGPSLGHDSGHGNGQGHEHEGGSGRWRALAELFTIRYVHTVETLLDHATFFLHRNLAKIADDTRNLLQSLHQTHEALSNRKVLIVDDDIRNIFALSTVLEDHGVLVLSAGNGRDAIELLRKATDIDVVLMDIMMPEMDGFETMRELRKIPALKNLPIIAVTAKAMKGDREKCIEAGAWDYLSKPVDSEQMLAVLRAWMPR